MRRSLMLFLPTQGRTGSQDSTRATLIRSSMWGLMGPSRREMRPGSRRHLRRLARSMSSPATNVDLQTMEYARQGAVALGQSSAVPSTKSLVQGIISISATTMEESAMRARHHLRHHHSQLQHLGQHRSRPQHRSRLHHHSRLQHRGQHRSRPQHRSRLHHRSHRQLAHACMRQIAM